MLHIYIDADACPVKTETYRVARRYNLEVTLVANSEMRIPDERLIRLEVVGDGFDAADDWIVEKKANDDIVQVHRCPSSFTIAIWASAVGTAASK